MLVLFKIYLRHLKILNLSAVWSRPTSVRLLESNSFAAKGIRISSNFWDLHLLDFWIMSKQVRTCPFVCTYPLECILFNKAPLEIA